MFAHSGPTGELPLPLSALIWITAGLQVAGFFTFALVWSRPALATAAHGTVLIERRRLTVIQATGRLLAVAFLALCVTAGFIGFNAHFLNILPVSFYVLCWVGGLLFATFVGDIWSSINPVTTIAMIGQRVANALGRAANFGPTAWGHWPAAVGLMIFLFWELAHPTGLAPRTVAWLVALHLVVVLVTGFLWGAEWVEDNEPFSALFATIGSMAPLFAVPERPHGLGFRKPLSGLATLTIRSGTAALLLVALGGSAFDGFIESDLGLQLLNRDGELQSPRPPWSLAIAELGIMIMVITVAAFIYFLAVAWADRTLQLGFDPTWNALSPVLVPVAAAYACAHYAKLFYDESQSVVFRLSDPFGRGWDLLGMSDGVTSPLDPDLAAWIQLIVLIVGHLAAMAVARDRLVALTTQAQLAEPKAIQAGYGFALAITAYAIASLWLLLAI